jgi:hypothetical protein
MQVGGLGLDRPLRRQAAQPGDDAVDLVVGDD